MKTIIEMAYEAKLLPSYEVYEEDLQRFAELVRAEAQAEEREACAKVCDARAEEQNASEKLAAAIRASGLPATQGGNE